MKKSIQILLAVASLLPLLSPAKEESMEERKQRIMRKYLRERSNIVYTDLAVPIENDPEDEAVLASEIYKENEVELSRSDAGTMPPPPPPPRLRPAVDRDWLLNAEDPYVAEDEGSKEVKKKDWLSPWGSESEDARYGRAENDPSPYGGIRRQSLFGSGMEAGSASSSGRNTDGQESAWSPFGDQSKANERNQFIFQPRGKRNDETSGGLFGPQRDNSSGNRSGTMDFSRDRNYRSGTERSPYLSPYTTGSEGSGRQLDGQNNRMQGYTPYKSPYETNRNRQQQGSSGLYQSNQEFQRADPYKAWKKRTMTPYDPTGDDAFVNELLPRGNNR